MGLKRDLINLCEEKYDLGYIAFEEVLALYIHYLNSHECQEIKERMEEYEWLFHSLNYS